MSEEGERQAVVQEALTWIGTPYVSNADIKGSGVDCGMLLVRVFADLGLIDKSFDPRPYPPQWALHQKEERFLNLIQNFSHEIEGPPKPGDVAIFKFGLCWAHGSIVINWPEIIHATPTVNSRAKCMTENVRQSSRLSRRPVRFFSYWS